MSVTRIVRCPKCGKSSEYSTINPHRPFCSERCRTNDLGAWAEGRYAVPMAPEEMSPEETESLIQLLETSEDDESSVTSGNSPDEES